MGGSIGLTEGVSLLRGNEKKADLLGKMADGIAAHWQRDSLNSVELGAGQVFI